MNSTGRRVQGLTKLDGDCNHRNTAWNERSASTEPFLTEIDRLKKKEQSAYLGTNPPSVWFPESSWWLGKMKKKQQREVLLSAGGKVIPVQCATQQPDSSCLCRRDILEKVLEQFLHWYFFTSEWVCRWALRLDLSAKALLQWGQENGFSPGSREKEDIVSDCTQIYISESKCLVTETSYPIIFSCLQHTLSKRNTPLSIFCSCIIVTWHLSQNLYFSLQHTTNTRGLKRLCESWTSYFSQHSFVQLSYKAARAAQQKNSGAVKTITSC